jgi:hypothetical protein
MSSLTNNHAAWFVNQDTGGTEYPNQYFLADMNGDGKADVVRINCQQSTDSGTVPAGRIRIGYSVGAGYQPGFTDPNQGFSGFVGLDPTDYYSPSEIICTSSERVEIVDVNLDGRADIVIYNNVETGAAIKVRINTGEWPVHFSAAHNLLNAVNSGPYSGKKNVVRFGDANCDGIPDLIRFTLSASTYLGTAENAGEVHVHLASSLCNKTTGCSFAQNAGSPKVTGFADEGDEVFIGRLYDYKPALGVGADLLVFHRDPGNNYYSSVATTPQVCGSPDYYSPVVTLNRNIPLGEANSSHNYKQQVFAADMNRDGRLDIVAFESNTDRALNVMWVSINRVPGTFGTAPYFDSYCCASIWPDLHCRQNYQAIWFSEPLIDTLADSRPRVFQLGDVDGDGYIDYVTFPAAVVSDLKAKVRFQMIVMVIHGISHTLSMFFPQPSGPTLEVNGPSSDWYQTGPKQVFDPFISYSKQNTTIYDAGYTLPVAGVAGNDFHERIVIPGSSSGLTLTGSCAGQAWDDVYLGVEPNETESMYQCAAYPGQPTVHDRVAITQTEQGQGIFHRMRYGIIYTTYRPGYTCPGQWLGGELWDQRKPHRDAVVVYLLTTRGCPDTQDGRAATHELSHVLHLYHNDCEDDACGGGNDWCTCGTDRTVEGYEWDTREYTYYLSDRSGGVLSAPTGSLSAIGYVTQAGNCNYNCDEMIIPFQPAWGFDNPVRAIIPPNP